MIRGSSVRAALVVICFSIAAGSALQAQGACCTFDSCLGAADEVSVETDEMQSMGLRLHRLTPRARAGFVPRTDVALYLAMAGAA